MAGSVGTGKRGADINVVPLIDIVLVLLIIFMVITPLIIKEMDVHLPEEEPPSVVTTPPPGPPQLVIVMQCKQKPANPLDQCADYNIYFGKDVVAENEIDGRVRQQLQGRKDEDKVLFFDAEDQVNYRAAVHVLDLARGAGVTKIGLITDRVTNLVPPGAPGAPAAPGH